MQRQYTKPAQINSGTDSKTVPASKVKAQCTGNTPDTLIIANRPRSEVYSGEHRASLIQASSNTMTLMWKAVNTSTYLSKLTTTEKSTHLDTYGHSLTSLFYQLLQYELQRCCTLYQWFLHTVAVGGLSMPINECGKRGELLTT